MIVSVEAKALRSLSAFLNEVPELQNRVWVSCLGCCDLRDDCYHTNRGATFLLWWPDLEGPSP